MRKSQYTDVFYNAFNIILIVFSFPANFTIETEIKAFNIKKTFFVFRRLRRHFLICLLNSPLFLRIKERLIN